MNKYRGLEEKLTGNREIFKSHAEKDLYSVISRSIMFDWSDSYLDPYERTTLLRLGHRLRKARFSNAETSEDINIIATRNNCYLAILGREEISAHDSLQSAANDIIKFLQSKHELHEESIEAVLFSCLSDSIQSRLE